MKFLVKFLGMLMLAFCGTAMAEDSEEPSSDFRAQILFVSHASANKEEQPSLFSKQLYAEKAITDDGWAMWGMAYGDQLYEGLYVGAAKTIGNWQIALGVGQAHYKGANHMIINPWVFYTDDDTEAMVTVDHYSKESVAPWYYKGYYHRKVSESFSVGMYGEKGVGLGPMIQYAWTKKVKLWATIPIAYEPSAGRTKAVIGFSIDF